MNTKSDEQYMSEALLMAEKALAMAEVPVGAVVVLDGKVVGRGHNRSVADRDPSAHAEVMALREAASAYGSFRLDGAILYVTIEPCLMCCGTLLQARIQRLVFGAREPHTGAVLSQFETLMAKENKHRVSITEGILAEQGAELMQCYFSSRR